MFVLIIKRFAYFRPSYAFKSPRDNYQDVYEGNIHAWYKQGNSSKVILFCHGNGGNLSDRQDKLIQLSKMGHSVLIFDYAGYGQSRGVPNETICFANGDMFVRYLLRKGYSRENIIPYGESLGACVACYLARKYNLPRVVVESGLPGIRYLIGHWYPRLSWLSILFDDFNTLSYLDGYKGKSLFLHSVDDDIVPIQTVKSFREKGTQFIVMSGTHNDPQIPWKDIETFLKD
ncbi:MAG: alpha/beta fold hydrolase [Verrucomicrobia bacterium]|nr:alpha/beta fold hydrolase [Verrucomicrobiota bacterium]